MFIVEVLVSVFGCGEPFQTGSGSQTRTSSRCSNQHWCAGKCWDLRALCKCASTYTTVAFPEHLTHIFVHLPKSSTNRPSRHRSPHSIMELHALQLSSESRLTSQDFQQLRVTKGPTNHRLVVESLPDPPTPFLAEPSSITVYHLNQTDIWRVWGCIHLSCLCGLYAL